MGRDIQEIIWEKPHKNMATFIAKNLQKTSVTLDSEGRVISENKSANRAEEMKQKQDVRAKRLGFKR